MNHRKPSPEARLTTALFQTCEPYDKETALIAGIAMVTMISDAIGNTRGELIDLITGTPIFPPDRIPKQ